MDIGIMTFINCTHATVEEQLDMLCRLGVCRSFLNAGHPRLDEVMPLFHERGIICDNFHSEFDGKFRGLDIYMSDMYQYGDAGDKMLEILFEDVLNCERHKVPVLVVHVPASPRKISDTPACNEKYCRLYDFAKEHGVTIAFENTQYFENLEHIFSLVPDSKLCWDCGHQYCNGDRKRILPVFGDRLTALHIHDNDLQKDLHFIPFEGSIDYKEVTNDLRNTGYDGTMMLEIMYRGQLPMEEYYTKAVKAARQLVSMVKEK